MHVVHAWKYKPKVSHSKVFFSYYTWHTRSTAGNGDSWLFWSLFLFWVSGLVTHFNKWWQIFTDKLYTKCFLKHSKAFFSFHLHCWSHVLDPWLEVQVRDCRASLWTTSVRWVMSCCLAWCLMHSRVRTWSKDGGGDIPATFMIKHHHSTGLKGEAVRLHVNLPTSGSRSSHVCGWGSTGWRTAGSACCFSGLREPTIHQTRKRLEHLVVVCTAAKSSHFRKHLASLA